MPIFPRWHSALAQMQVLRFPFPFQHPPRAPKEVSLCIPGTLLGLHFFLFSPSIYDPIVRLEFSKNWRQFRTWGRGKAQGLMASTGVFLDTSTPPTPGLVWIEESGVWEKNQYRNLLIARRPLRVACVLFRAPVGAREV